MMSSNRFMESLETRLLSAFEFSVFRSDVSGESAMRRPPFSQVTGGRAFQEAAGRCGWDVYPVSILGRWRVNSKRINPLIVDQRVATKNLPDASLEILIYFRRMYVGQVTIQKELLMKRQEAQLFLVWCEGEQGSKRSPLSVVSIFCE